MLKTDVDVSNRYGTIVHATHCAYGETLQVYVRMCGRGLIGTSPDELMCLEGDGDVR